MRSDVVGHLAFLITSISAWFAAASSVQSATTDSDYSYGDHVDAVPKLVAAASHKLAGKIHNLVHDAVPVHGYKWLKLLHSPVPGTSSHMEVARALERIEKGLNSTSSSILKWTQAHSLHDGRQMRHYKENDAKVSRLQRVLDSVIDKRQAEPLRGKIAELESEVGQLESEVQAYEARNAKHAAAASRKIQRSSDAQQTLQTVNARRSQPAVDQHSSKTQPAQKALRGSPRQLHDTQPKVERPMEKQKVATSSDPVGNLKISSNLREFLFALPPAKANQSTKKEVSTLEQDANKYLSEPDDESDHRSKHVSHKVISKPAAPSKAEKGGLERLRHSIEDRLRKKPSHKQVKSIAAKLKAQKTTASVVPAADPVKGSVSQKQPVHALGKNTSATKAPAALKNALAKSLKNLKRTSDARQLLSEKLKSFHSKKPSAPEVSANAKMSKRLQSTAAAKSLRTSSKAENSKPNPMVKTTPADKLKTPKVHAQIVGTAAAAAAKAEKQSTKTADVHVSGSKKIEQKPTTKTLVASKPVVSKPAASKPAVSKPAVSKPAVSKTAVSKPAVSKPAVSKPAVSKPLTHKTVTSAKAPSKQRADSSVKSVGMHLDKKTAVAPVKVAPARSEAKKHTKSVQQAPPKPASSKPVTVPQKESVAKMQKPEAKSVKEKIVKGAKDSVQALKKRTVQTSSSSNSLAKLEVESPNDVSGVLDSADVMNILRAEYGSATLPFTHNLSKLEVTTNAPQGTLAPQPSANKKTSPTMTSADAETAKDARKHDDAPVRSSSSTSTDVTKSAVHNASKDPQSSSSSLLSAWLDSKKGSTVTKHSKTEASAPLTLPRTMVSVSRTLHDFLASKRASAEKATPPDGSFEQLGAEFLEEKL